MECNMCGAECECVCGSVQLIVYIYLSGWKISAFSVNSGRFLNEIHHRMYNYNYATTAM